MVAQQLEAEAVDEEDDVAARLGQHAAPSAAEAGVDAERAGDRREHVPQRPVARRRARRRPGLGPARRHPAVRADSVSAKASRLATASGPSAAALTRSEKSSEAEHPGVAVVGLALGVGAAGRLEVDAARRRPSRW